MVLVTKREDVTKQCFCKILSRKLRLRGSLLLVLIPFWGVVWGRGWALIQVWVGVAGMWGGGGRLFERGRLLTFSAFRMGAYSRWALIRGWALIRINTVFANRLSFSEVIRWYFAYVKREKIVRGCGIVLSAPRNCVIVWFPHGVDGYVIAWLSCGFAKIVKYLGKATQARLRKI